MNHKFFASVNQLIDIGINQNSIRSGIANYLNGDRRHWECSWESSINDFKINFQTIPASELRHLPNGLPNDVLGQLKEIDLNLINDLWSASKDYSCHLHKYKAYSKAKRKIKAKTHAVISVAYQYRYNCRYPLMRLSSVLEMLNFQFYPSYGALSRVLSRLKSQGGERLESILADPRKGKAGRKKVTSEMEFVIHFLHGEGFRARTIRDKINAIFFPTSKGINKRTVLNYLPIEIRNLYGLTRYGYDWWKRNYFDYVVRKRSDYIFQVVEADGSRFQIPFYDPLNDKVVFVSFFVIQDSHSGKILATSYGWHENSEMILETFQNLSLQYGILPSTLVLDPSAAATSNAFKIFKRKAEDMGTVVIIHEARNPQAKGGVESFFRNFHASICIEDPWFVGLGLTATTVEYGLKKDVFMKLRKNRKKLHRLGDASKVLRRFLDKWNSTSFDDISTPDEKFAIGKIRDARILKNHEIALLYWKRCRRVLIKSKINLDQVEFRVNDLDVKLRHRQVNVYFNPNQPSNVYLFDLEGNYLCEAVKKHVVTYDPKLLSAADRKEIRDVKRRRKNDQKTIKKRIALQTDMALKVIKNFQEAEIFCPTSKETEMLIYNQLANFNNEFDEMDGFVRPSSRKIMTHKRIDSKVH